MQFVIRQQKIDMGNHFLCCESLNFFIATLKKEGVIHSDLQNVFKDYGARKIGLCSDFCSKLPS